jgi:hypothetical protein
VKIADWCPTNQQSEKVHPRRFRKHIPAVLAIAGVLSALTFILWPYLFESFIGRRESQRQVHHLVNSLSLGHAMNTVEQLLTRPEYDKLRLFKADPTRWALETPSIPGARNWVVYLEFTGSQLSRVAVRTADSVNEIPAAAPADKVAVR